MKWLLGALLLCACDPNYETTHCGIEVLDTGYQETWQLMEDRALPYLEQIYGPNTCAGLRGVLGSLVDQPIPRGNGVWLHGMMWVDFHGQTNIQVATVHNVGTTALHELFHALDYVFFMRLESNHSSWEDRGIHKLLLDYTNQYYPQP